MVRIIKVLDSRVYQEFGHQNVWLLCKLGWKRFVLRKLLKKKI